MTTKRKAKQPPPRPANRTLVDRPSGVAPGNNESNKRMIIAARQQFSGPLPPPDMLLKYNDIVPDGAERIIVMAEKQQNHRIYLEKLVVE